MLASLVSRLRTKIQLLEKELSPWEIEPYWLLLRQAEDAVLHPDQWKGPCYVELEKKLKNMIGVRG